MPINVEPMFLDYKAWRSQNEELAEELRGGIDPRSACPCDCVGLSRFGEPYEHCNECDGSGTVGGDLASEVERQMRAAYETRLERDYRLAVRAIPGCSSAINANQIDQPAAVSHG